MDSISRAPQAAAERVERDDPNAPAVGRWFWVTPKAKEKTKTQERWLACVTHVGSNYAQLVGPNPRYCDSTSSVRVHLDEWDETCRLEPDADAIIKARSDAAQVRVAQLMGEIQEITRRLGVGEAHAALPDVGADTSALAVATAGAIDEYKSALVKAKQSTLPDLFRKVEIQNKLAAQWMSASLIPLRAEADKMQPTIERIEARIYNVELYAGLKEEVVQIADGRPAGASEPIHLHQRRAYMDEECLLDYQVGGMDFQKLEEFDAWMAEPAHRDRLLPHPRCVVAFQVRRSEKEHDFEGSWRKMISFYLNGYAEADKWTFLYMRNGERLYRLATTIKFEDPLFPDQDKRRLDHAGKLYAKRDGTVISEGEYLALKESYALAVARAEAKFAEETREYEAAKAEYEKKRAEYDAAIAAGASPKYKGERYWRYIVDSDGLEGPLKPSMEPYLHRPQDESDGFEPFDDSTVFYDDYLAAQKKRIDSHNRLALVLQGVIDRSAVFHPHPADWKLWTPDGFARAVVLVYDDSRALTADVAPPDFEEYRARLNSGFRAGSVAVGQDDFWSRAEAAKENARERNRSGDRYYERTHYRPSHNPGPGVVARVAEVSPDRSTCTFRWTRERQVPKIVQVPIPEKPGWVRRKRDYSGEIPCKISIPASALLNASAYKLGDYKQFFADPRTRAQYLRWAPLLLLAEEYAAGHRAVGAKEEAD
jgi:hypothetical protein